MVSITWEIDMRWVDWRSNTHDMGVAGLIQETNEGTLIRAATLSSQSVIYRSTDSGASWDLRQIMTVPSAYSAGVKAAFVDSRGHIYMGGTVQTCTYENYSNVPAPRAELWKSTDDGLNWTKVCTSETSAFWHMSEDSLGRVYVNEYSLVPSSGTEYPAVNVWRSDAAGSNFTKWVTAPKESAPGVKDGIRHIHSVYVSPADEVYLCYGDTGWADPAGHVLKFNLAGVQQLDYGRFSNGSTSSIAAQDGAILVGKDNNPSGIDLLNPLVAISCQQCNLQKEFGNRFDAYVFDLIRTEDNVIFGNVTLSSRYGSIIYSTDEGRNWNGMNIGNIQGNTMTYNPNGRSNSFFLSGACQRIDVPSRLELGWKRPWHVPR